MAPILVIGVGLIVSYLIIKNPLKNIELVPSLVDSSIKTDKSLTKPLSYNPKVENLGNTGNLLEKNLLTDNSSRRHIGSLCGLVPH